MRTPVSGLDPVEALEQTWQLLLGNTDAGICHFEQPRGHRFGSIEP